MGSKLANQASAIIHQMDQEELNDVVRAIKLRREYLARQATGTITVGDEVEFYSTKTGRVVGIAVKVNQKTVVVESGFRSWKVPGAMLTKTEAA